MRSCGIEATLMVEAKGGRVLVIEDDEDLVLLLSLMLKRDGFACKVAGTVSEARQVLQSEAFDYVLLDLVLPDGNGGDLLAAMASGPCREAAVIVSSGNVHDDLRSDPRVRGVFQKPYDLRDLLRFMTEAE